MKFQNKLILGMAAVAMMAASCSEDPAMPPMVVPEAPNLAKVNATLLDVKTQYWQDDRNYSVEIGTNADGEHIYVKGRVTGVDVSGNIYKYIYIQDESAALCFSINEGSLNETYKIGAELVVDLTGMHIGKYSEELLVGEPEWYAAQNVWETGRMTLATFEEHTQINGLPIKPFVEPLETTIPTILSKSDKDGFLNFGHRLVAIAGVKISGAGKKWNDDSNPHTVSSTTGSVTSYYHSITDANGKSMPLPVSPYADFAFDTVPEGYCTLTGIICYKYNGNDRTTNWQLFLVDIEGVQPFDGEISGGDDPTPGPGGDGDGTKEAPYTVADVLAMGSPGSTAWTKGYIVGWIDGKTLAEGARFDANATATSNIMIAAEAGCTDLSLCVPVQLPVGAVRDALNLQSHPENLGKEVTLFGSLEKYFGAPGIKNVSEFELEGYVAPVGTGFTKVTAITSGRAYAFWVDGMVGTAFAADKNYGYLNVTDCPLNGSSIDTAEANAFTFTEHTQGWTIQCSDGRYLYLTGTYTSFNINATLDESNAAYYFTVTPQADGTFEIKNNGNGYVMQKPADYKSFGIYPDTRGALPSLFELTK